MQDSDFFNNLNACRSWTSAIKRQKYSFFYQADNGTQ